MINCKATTCKQIEETSLSGLMLLAQSSPPSSPARVSSGSTCAWNGNTLTTSSNKMTTTMITSKDIRDDDVIMGREIARSEHKGNLRYRDIIHLFTKEYVYAKKRIEKERITNLVKEAVESSGGRFLRPLSGPPENGGKPDDYPSASAPERDENSVFVVESNAKIMEKIKRALRSSKWRYDQGATSPSQLRSSIEAIDTHQGLTQSVVSQPAHKKQVCHRQNQHRKFAADQIRNTGVSAALLAQMNIMQQDEPPRPNNSKLVNSSVIELLLRQSSPMIIPTHTATVNPPTVASSHLSSFNDIAPQQRLYESLLSVGSGTFTTSNSVSPASGLAGYDKPILNALAARRHLIAGIDCRNTISQPYQSAQLPGQIQDQIRHEVRSLVRSQLAVELLNNIYAPSSRR